MVDADNSSAHVPADAKGDVEASKAVHDAKTVGSKEVHGG